MTPEKKLPENQIEEFLSEDSTPSIDDFIKELEEKEKDLNISSDLVVEIEESEVGETDTLELLKFLDSCQETSSTNGSAAKHSEASPRNSGENVTRLENEVEMLRRQISKFETERNEVNELVRRRQYDFDNYRKRTERERGEMYHNVLSKVAMEILPVLDNLSRALESAARLPGKKSDDFQQFVDGIELVNQQLNEVLEEMGIKPIIAVGEPFNPHLHEAVTAVHDSTVPPNTVVAELLRGYHLDGKVIRHAMVKVSRNGNSEPGQVQLS